MPKLSDFRKTKTISLPSFPDSKVEIYDSLLVGDMFGVTVKEGQELQLMIEKLPRLIKSWNFTDEHDQPLEINRENLNFLKVDDLGFILQQISDFAAENKKK